MIIFEAIGSDILIRGRHTDGKRYEERRKYRPYFYAVDPEGEYTSLFGDKLKKIEVKHPGQMKTEKEKYSFKDIYEGDVTYINRYMIDCIPEIKNEPVRCAFLDIEVDDEGSYPDVAKADKLITAVCIYDSFKKKYHAFALRPPTFPGNDEIRKTDKRNTYIFNKEEDMLNAIVEFIHIYDFDIFWAWNGDAFDYPYLFRRIDDPKRFSPIKELDNRSGMPKGRVWLDLMWAYRKMLTSELESKGLDFVAKREGLGGKLEHEGRVSDLWKSDFEKFIDYNVHDVELMVGIEKAKKVLNYFNGVRKMTYCYWYDVRHNSRTLDFYILKKAHDAKIVMPNSARVTSYEPIEGARVIDPIPGLHNMVACVDVRSLYPSAIMLGNMSPETFDLNGQIKIGPGTFRSDVRGFVPTIVVDLWDYRQSVKKEMKSHPEGSKEHARLDELQTVIKFLLNSIYGILLMPKSRIFMRDIGAAITYFGRMFNIYMEGVARSFGVEIIAGDTDSLYFKVKSIEQAQEITDAINAGIPKFIEDNFGDPKYNIVYVEFEKVYLKAFFMGDESGGSVKKRYAGLVCYKDGHTVDPPVIDIKGFEAKRSDTPGFIRDLQKQVLLDILSNVNRKEITTKIATVRNDILNGKYPPEELAIPKGMSKLPHEYTKNIPPHVTGVIYSNAYLGTNIKRDKVKFVYVTGVPEKLPRTHVISFMDKMPSGFTVNYAEMAKTLIDLKFTNILVSMGWDLIELNGYTVQKGDAYW